MGNNTDETYLDKLLINLHTSKEGLTQQQANTKLQTFGPNSITISNSESLLKKVIVELKNPLLLMLIGVSTVSYLMGEYIDGSIVLAMVIISSFLNIYQESKANNAATKLKSRVALNSTVKRDGKFVDLPSSQLVPGDIINLNAGDLIPADCHLIDSKNCYVNQSTLTGESFPVGKLANNSDSEENKLFAGTNIITGNATAVVINTGPKTQFGQIINKLNLQEQDNDFTIGIKKFSLFVVRIVSIFVIIIFATNLLIKHDFWSAFSFSIAVAVGLTPEFLPMIMTVNMSKGALNMSKKGVIVKKLTSIPTFGSMNLLATDKTGTLTKDNITLVKATDMDGDESTDVLFNTYLNSYFETGITNPLDTAVLNFSKFDLANYSKIEELPFDFERKRMSIIVQTNSQKILICKGAPESIIQNCTSYYHNGQSQKLKEDAYQVVTNQYNAFSKEGYRVLAVAKKNLDVNKATYEINDETDMEFLGFVAFLDPVKDNAKQAIQQLSEIGIEMKVVTGDNELVTAKICHDANISIKGILTSQEFENLNESELLKIIPNTTIFARFSPLQKEQIINLMKKFGYVVGYMGDGINDAPSLKAADIGISVSNAVDVAKETADLILTQKDLTTLTTGVIEGRKTFGNTMKYIHMGLSSNFGNMFSVLIASLFLPFLPMLPIQILLNNFLYDLSQLTIPTDNVDKEYLLNPKSWNISSINKFMLIFGPISSIFDLLTFGTMLFIFNAGPSVFQTAWFMESLATQSLVIYFIRTTKIPFIQSSPSKYLFISVITCVLIGWIIPFTNIGSLVGFSPLSTPIVLSLIGLTFFYLILVEIGKKIYFKIA